MKTAFLLVLLIIPFASLFGAEPVFGTGVSTRIDLVDSITFAVVAKPGTDKLCWEILQKRNDGESRMSSGYEIDPKERFVYWWSPENRTLWVATSKIIEKTVLLDGLKTTTGGIYSLKGYENISDIPADFKKAVADLLAAK